MAENGGWFPLRRQILDSSVWEEPLAVRVLWVTILLVASEPGRRGTVDMTLRLLAARAAMSPEEAKSALEILMAPDPQSRTHEHEGRRLLPLDPDRSWGWRVANWDAYEEAREAAFHSVRQQRYRDRHSPSRTVTEPSQEDALPSRHVTESHALSLADPEKEKEKENIYRGAPAPKTPRFLPPSIEEVRAEVQTKGFHFSAERFWAHYESNGWMVGKNKMKSWKACCITWEKGEGNGNGKPSVDEADAARREKERIEYNRKVTAEVQAAARLQFQNSSKTGGE